MPPKDPSKSARQFINTVLLAGVLAVGGYIGTTVMDTRDRVIRIEVSRANQIHWSTNRAQARLFPYPCGSLDISAN